MRLINTSTSLFEEFVGRNIPKYAIFSHTWEDEEVSFKVMRKDPSCRKMKGFQKIAMVCRMASRAGYRYVWVDTCCIDKSSSAELSDSINSMYKWYQRSEICYVFLSDLSVSEDLGTALPCCRWFTRGWTLQELIAPRNMILFDQDWNAIGSKADMLDDLARITGVDAAVLQGSRPLSTVTVAQKMSWVAHRETTRIKDMAYCLFGIFDVNMPLLYGEENKAFRRLQAEIIKSTADFSIFAWKAPAVTRTSPTARVFCGVLAEWPLYFAESRSISKLAGQDTREFSISNSGVKVQSPIFTRRLAGQGTNGYVLPLHCTRSPDVSLAIRLRKCVPDQYVREDPWELVDNAQFPWRGWGATQARTLLTDIPEEMATGMDFFIGSARSHALQIRCPSGIRIHDVWPLARYDGEDHAFFVSGDVERDVAAVRLRIVCALSDGQTRDSDIMFYAFGWSSPDINQLQCTMVNYQSFSVALNQVQFEV